MTVSPDEEECNGPHHDHQLPDREPYAIELHGRPHHKTADVPSTRVASLIPSLPAAVRHRAPDKSAFLQPMLGNPLHSQGFNDILTI